MELHERKNVDFKLLSSCLEELRESGLNIRLFTDSVNPISDDVVLVFDNDSIYFDSLKDCFESLKPLLKNVYDFKQECANKERIFRNMLSCAIENVCNNFDKELYTISLGKREK